MDHRLYKTAYKRVLEKKFFFRHLLVFVIGNFLLFFISLNSWTPGFFYLLTLIWMRILAIHFKNAYPEVAANFRFNNEYEEDKAIKKEMKRLKKLQKQKQKQLIQNTAPKESLPLKPAYAKSKPKNYEDSDLV